MLLPPSILLIPVFLHVLSLSPVRGVLLLAALVPIRNLNDKTFTVQRLQRLELMHLEAWRITKAVVRKVSNRNSGTLVVAVTVAAAVAIATIVGSIS
jgi:uncharacterized BrkB/YihY/UPF0761 family membrane protein